MLKSRIPIQPVDWDEFDRVTDQIAFERAQAREKAGALVSAPSGEVEQNASAGNAKTAA
jgi:hypothetical protein